MPKKINMKVLAAVMLISISAVVYSCRGTGMESADNVSDVVYFDSELSEGREISDEKEMLASGRDTYTEISESTATEILIYVCGQVVSPGVYTLEEGARIVDALEAAGGMTEDAGADRLNLASVVHDGDRIYVPSVDEEIEPGMNNLSDVSDSMNQQDLRVNINTASKEQLMTLPGIGAAKAESIIKYRENYGVFQSVEALKEVPGIKTGVYEGLKDLITTD